MVSGRSWPGGRPPSESYPVCANVGLPPVSRPCKPPRKSAVNACNRCVGADQGCEISNSDSIAAFLVSCFLAKGCFHFRPRAALGTQETVGRHDVGLAYAIFGILRLRKDKSLTAFFVPLHPKPRCLGVPRVGLFTAGRRANLAGNCVSAVGQDPVGTWLRRLPLTLSDT